MAVEWARNSVSVKPEKAGKIARIVRTGK